VPCLHNPVAQTIPFGTWRHLSCRHPSDAGTARGRSGGL
jgi:hypothetical protein